MQQENSHAVRPNSGRLLVRGRLSFGTFFTTCFVAVVGSSLVLGLVSMVFIAVGRMYRAHKGIELPVEAFPGDRWIHLWGIWMVQAVVSALLAGLVGYLVYRFVARLRGGYVCRVYVDGEAREHDATVFWRSLRGRIGIIPLFVMLALGGSVIYLFQQAPLYRTGVRVLVTPADKPSAYLQVEMRLISSRMMHQLAREKLGSHEEDLLKPLKAVSVRAERSTSMLLIEVEAFDPHFAAEFANALAEAYREFRAGSEEVEVEILEPARPPAEPFHPRKTRTIGAAALGGALAGLVIALTWAAFQYRRELLDNPQGSG